jgi:hypothetical protein
MLFEQTVSAEASDSGFGAFLRQSLEVRPERGYRRRVPSE